MKHYRFLLVLLMFTVLSCSSDKEDNALDEALIVGTWDATRLTVDDGTANDGAKNARDILDFLTAKDCYIISFTFKSDLSVTAHNSSNYIEINVNSAGTGLDIPCPVESDVEESTYEFDGSVLTLVDSEGGTILVDVEIDGDTMVVDASDLDIENFNEGGELIFIRR
ncbi:MAG: hypothetical protein CR994_04300 [Maribacter sp.]|nr:MAG: hypothetical protein CR994_04300 [Maribacter sp.]